MPLSFPTLTRFWSPKTAKAMVSQQLWLTFDDDDGWDVLGPPEDGWRVGYRTSEGEFGPTTCRMAGTGAPCECTGSRCNR